MMMKKDMCRSVVFAGVLLVLAAVFSGCGGDSSSAESPVTTATFWAADFTTYTLYKVTGVKVGEGVHCQIYVEQGRTVDGSVITSIINEFDTKIYPKNTTTFGNEPNPGIDNDAKVYILLLDIKDGYDPVGSPSYVGGYFDPGNEYPLSVNAYSNQKEMFYMDINPATPGSIRFFSTLAHEFQHMIHWQQEEVYKNHANDEVWLNEAMSEVAPVYCGYGPSYNRVQLFEYYPNDSLTDWGGSVIDYGVAYMWGQYFKDHFGSYNIFRAMLQNSNTGIDSVNSALAEISALDTDPTFTSTFHDWAIAVYSGNTRTWPDHPEWSYITIDTWPGTYNGYTLPGLLPNPAPTSLPLLERSSLAFYSYTPVTDPIGTINWAGGTGAVKAALADKAPSLFSDLVSGQNYTFLTTGYLILSNSSDSATAGAGDVTNTSLFQNITSDALNSVQTEGPAMSPRAMLDRANSDPVLRRRVAETGEPEALCIHSFIKEKEKPLREKARKLRGRHND